MFDFMARWHGRFVAFLSGMFARRGAGQQGQANAAGNRAHNIPWEIVLMAAALVAAAVIYFFLGLNTPYLPLVLGVGATATLIAYMARQREGLADIVSEEPGHAGGGHGHGRRRRPAHEEEVPPRPLYNWWAMVLGVILFIVHYWPVAWSWWNDADYAIPTLTLWVGLWAIFILYSSRITPPAALYWAWLSAWGASWLRWGFYWTFLAGAGQTGATETGVMALWVIAMDAFIIATVTWVIVQSARLSEKNRIFFRLNRPGVVKAVMMGSTVQIFIGDLTGVPRARELVPANIRRRGVRAIWQWMCESPVRRVDPRPFLTQWAWVGPAFFYPGIPYFTRMASLVAKLFGQSHDEGGGQNHAAPIGEFAELRVMSNIDSEVPPVPTGPGGPELSLKVGVVLQNGCPPLNWTTPDLDHWLEHEVETLVANLARVVGTFLYGFTGDPALLGAGLPARPETQMNPAMEPVPPQAVANLLQHFQDEMQRVGFRVHQIVLKDVNLSGNIEKILEDRIAVHVRRQAATEQAETVRLVARGQLDAFMEAAAAGGGIPDNVRGDILKELAKLFFLQGSETAGLLGVVTTIGSAAATGAAPK